LEVVILRPSLIYGPLVKANFYQLMNAVYRRLPLPLGGIRNQRSLLYVNTLADAIKHCLTHPNASGKTFLVSDEKSVSTADLIMRLGSFLHCSPRLLNVPISWMKFGGKCLGKSAVIDRLTSSLVVDSSKIRQELSWSSPYSFDWGLQKTAEWFLASKSQPH
jgi:nucleoside-diphosphate-sugar epimerase